MLWVVLCGVRHVKTAIFSAVVLYVLTEHWLGCFAEIVKQGGRVSIWNYTHALKSYTLVL